MKKETVDTIIKVIINLFRLEKEKNTIKERIIKRYITNFFRLEKENKMIKDIIKT